ncbi:MAG: hypothetical protein AB7O59_06665 [Pirellulales bacterium]
MRRLRDRPANKFFRGAELPRLLTMLIMLGVLVMLIDVARNPKTWRWLVPDAGPEQPADAVPDLAAQENVAAPEPPTSGPTDLDADELDAAREEFQAITDKAPLRSEEMAAYWRLMAWEEHQSTEALLARARRDVTFKQLYEHPEQWRGKLVRLRVHLQQTADARDLADNPLGLKSVSEVWGWNNDSQPYWYWLVVPHLPPGMPTGQNIAEEATFVGYFFKLLRYEDHRGEMLASPLLIGRLVWHPSAGSALARDEGWTWTWYLAAGLAALLVVRFVGRLAAGRRSDRAGLTGRTDPQQVEAWLSDAEQAGADENGHPRAARTSGNGLPPWEITGPAPHDGG